jgi:virginiamycin B lyase
MVQLLAFRYRASGDLLSATAINRPLRDVLLGRLRAPMPPHIELKAAAGAHDVYPAPDGTVWFTAQSAGKLGRLDPRTRKSELIALGPGAAPHGVIVGPDGAAWVTEGGQNAIARVDPATHAVTPCCTDQLG